MNVSNLSSDQKDKVIAALLQSYPDLVQKTIRQVTGTTPEILTAASSPNQQICKNKHQAPAQKEPSPKKKRTQTHALDYPLTNLPKSELWEARLQQLTVYQRANGHCKVPVGSQDYPYLGRWVDNQRQAYRCYMEGKASWLDKERIEALTKIGFVWSIRTKLVSLETRLSQMENYRKIHGHLRVPQRRDPAGLSHWIQEQRRNRRLGKMSDERKAALDAVGFEWEATGKLGKDNSNTNKE